MTTYFEYLEGCVTPHVGVWIETKRRSCTRFDRRVTPHVGVWIETRTKVAHVSEHAVTPHVGVWIETTPYNFIES